MSIEKVPKLKIKKLIMQANREFFPHDSKIVEDAV